MILHIWVVMAHPQYNMEYKYTTKEDGRNWWIINNLEEWNEFTQLLAGYEPVQYPCLINERITYGYCKEVSEFFVRYDV